MKRVIVALALVCWSLTYGVAHADDWTAEQLRGRVLQLIDNQWQPLARGSIVPDSRVVRTLATGRVTFTRGNETIDVGPYTQIQIYDKGGRKPFTTVKQYFGSVSVEAQVEQVQHFAVDTPYLAAVVKGTRFTVTSGRTGARVEVRRGHVWVEDKQDKTRVTLSVGQSASVGRDGGLEVRGSGALPVVVGASGVPVVEIGVIDDKAAQAAEKAAKKAEKAAAKAAAKAEKDAKKADDDNSGSSSSSGSSGSSGSGSSGSGNSGSGKGKGKGKD